ncbi:hypothetical protein BH09BAC5_BH09BAC5_26410 [soil metagenome]
MHETGIWWSFGDFCWNVFHGLEWTYNNLSPNKIFIVVLFAAFTWWMAWQHKFNQKAIKEGGLK